MPADPLDPLAASELDAPIAPPTTLAVPLASAPAFACRAVARMSAITIPAWYMAMWVKAPSPVRSPTAQTWSVTCSRSSTGR